MLLVCMLVERWNKVGCKRGSVYYRPDQQDFYFLVYGPAMANPDKPIDQAVEDGSRPRLQSAQEAVTQAVRETPSALSSTEGYRLEWQYHDPVVG